MRDGWYYLIYQKNEAWIDGVRKRIVPEVIQETIITAFGELRDFEGFIEIKDGKGRLSLEQQR